MEVKRIIAKPFEHLSGFSCREEDTRNGVEPCRMRLESTQTALSAVHIFFNRVFASLFKFSRQKIERFPLGVSDNPHSLRGRNSKHQDVSITHVKLIRFE